MEGSSKSDGQQYHVRSISLPSRLHPTSIKIETELNNINTLFSVGSPLSPITIQDGLVGLAELYVCVEELIHSSHTKQTLLQHQGGAFVENALEVSIGLLDSCATLKDLFSLMKENMQDLQSALRRKSGDLSIESHVSTYFCLQKQAKKIISKSLKALKKTEGRNGASLPLDMDQHLSMVVRVLSEISDITIYVFRSILLFLSVSCSSRTKPSSRWSLISNLMMKSSTSCERDQRFMNEVEIVELSLCSLHSRVDVQMAQKSLQKLYARTECFQSGVDCIFRRLIQNRVSLLNILAN